MSELCSEMLKLATYLDCSSGKSSLVKRDDPGIDECKSLRKVSTCLTQTLRELSEAENEGLI